MPDIRERVEEDRGLLKRIQLFIPGFAGYRRKEDLRTADNLLRIQIANKLKETRGTLDSARAALTSNYQMKALEPMGVVMMKVQGLEGQIRHAEQGYSGLVADVKVLEPQLNKLYEWDAALLDGVVALQQHSSALEAQASGDVQKALEAINGIRKLLMDMEATFKRRMNVITGTEVI